MCMYAHIFNSVCNKNLKLQRIRQIPLRNQTASRDSVFVAVETGDGYRDIGSLDVSVENDPASSQDSAILETPSEQAKAAM